MVLNDSTGSEYRGKRVHVVGIKGTGVLGLATVYHEMGAIVTGSDVADTFVTDVVLSELGITPQSFSATNITSDISLVVHSTAYNDTHIEIARAHTLGIPVRTYTTALAEMVNAKKSIVVTGSHGKTTTSAMIATMLEHAGFDPTAVIGGMVSAWGRTARFGGSEWMVVEGDEYQEKILSYKAHIAVITNVDWDHPDYFKTQDAYEHLFRTFVESLSDASTLIISQSAAAVLKTSIAKTRARVVQYEPVTFSLRVFGAHNALNAGAALAVAHAVGMAGEVATQSLSAFQGTKRRMEYYSDPEANQVLIDDFAHHPTEIRATLAAVRSRYPKRHIIAVFQAHTYTRTQTFLEDFVASFSDADEVLVLPIFASAREQVSSLTADDFASAIRVAHESVRACLSIEDAVALIRSSATTAPSVVVALGAGEQWRIVDALAH